MFLLTMVLWVCAGCLPKEPTQEQTVAPGVTLYGVNIHYFQGERLATVGQMAKLTYQRFTHDFVGESSDLKFPKQGPSDPHQRLALQGFRLRSPILRGNITTRRATGLGGVTFIADNGTIGQTARADFDGIARTAEGKDPIQVVGRRYTINAGDFSFELREEDYTFSNGVITEIAGTHP